MSFFLLYSVVNSFPVQSIFGTPAAYCHTGITANMNIFYDTVETL